MIELPAGDLSAGTGHSVDHSLAQLILAIGAAPVFATIARIDLHGIVERAGETVMAIEQIGPLQRMAVPAEHQVHAMTLQDRHDILPNLNQLALEIRIMIPPRVGRMMKEN